MAGNVSAAGGVSPMLRPKPQAAPNKPSVMKPILIGVCSLAAIAGVVLLIIFGMRGSGDGSNGTNVVNALTCKICKDAGKAVFVFETQAELDNHNNEAHEGVKPAKKDGAISSLTDEEKVADAVGLVVIAWEVVHQTGEVEEYVSLPCVYTAAEFLNLPSSARSELKMRKSGTTTYYYESLLGSTGSCFLVTHDGYAITNQHVIEGYDRITKVPSKIAKITKGGRFEKITPVIFVFFKGEEYRAKLVHVSSQYDHAILKIDKINNAPFFALSGTEEIKRGKKVTTLGFPGGARKQVLSVKEMALDEARKTSYKKIVEFFSKDAYAYDQNEGSISKPADRPVGRLIQHNAIINHGNSGGPLVDSDCSVFGINTFGISTGGIQGIFFSVQMHQLKSEIDSNVKGVVWR